MSRTPITTLEQARTFFAQDRYATDNGMTIEDAAPGFSRIRLELTERHRNAVGGVMGGVQLTMADFACAVASNYGPDARPHVSLDAHISFQSACRGGVLFAEAKAVKTGRSVSFYEVAITDDTGRLVAKAEFTMFCTA